MALIINYNQVSEILLFDDPFCQLSKITMAPSYQISDTLHLSETLKTDIRLYI